jgi:hypothetical protein
MLGVPRWNSVRRVCLVLVPEESGSGARIKNAVLRSGSDQARRVIPGPF